MTFAPQTKAKEATNGLRTPLLLRNALSSGLARVWSGRGLSTPAPAVTVMEVSSSKVWTDTNLSCKSHAAFCHTTNALAAAWFAIFG